MLGTRKHITYVIFDNVVGNFCLRNERVKIGIHRSPGLHGLGFSFYLARFNWYFAFNDLIFATLGGKCRRSMEC